MKIVKDDNDFGDLDGIRLFVDTKSFRLNFRVVNKSEGEYVSTSKGQMLAHLGYIIMTGVTNDNYVMTPESFNEKYEDIVYTSTFCGKATKKIPDEYRCVVYPTHDYKVITYLGVINAKAYEPLIRYKNKDYGVLSDEMLELLYTKI